MYDIWHQSTAQVDMGPASQTKQTGVVSWRSIENIVH